VPKKPWKGVASTFRSVILRWGEEPHSPDAYRKGLPEKEILKRREDYRKRWGERGEKTFKGGYDLLSVLGGGGGEEGLKSRRVARGGQEKTLGVKEGQILVISWASPNLGQGVLRGSLHNLSSGVDRKRKMRATIRGAGTSERERGKREGCSYGTRLKPRGI